MGRAFTRPVGPRSIGPTCDHTPGSESRISRRRPQHRNSHTAEPNQILSYAFALYIDGLS
jgi:hypothetical protein